MKVCQTPKNALNLILADRMFDMGFEPQISRIIQNIRPDRQTVLFSATFPRAVEATVRRILRNPVEISVRGVSVVSDTIEQHVEVCVASQQDLILLGSSRRRQSPKIITTYRRLVRERKCFGFCGQARILRRYLAASHDFWLQVFFLTRRKGTLEFSKKKKKRIAQSLEQLLILF